MKVQTLINKLEKLKEKHGNIEVVIDFDYSDNDGWYKCETVEKVNWPNSTKKKHESFINITWEK